MDTRTSPLQATFIRRELRLSIKPFGLDVKVLLTTEAAGGFCQPSRQPLFLGTIIARRLGREVAS
jgi:hypothetical protein